jgi:RNA polymerase sigma factor (sigma-70 family)
MPTNDGGAAAEPARHITPGEFPAFYTAEYPKLVKILLVMGARMGEAEDAAQKAMTYFFRTDQTSISRPAAYVRKVAIRYFVKECKRDRERLSREIKGGHLTLPAYVDDGLTACEEEQWVDRVLESLTPAQRDVIKLVIQGASNHEIAEELGKRDATIRQLRKTGLGRLLEHPEVASRAPRDFRPGIPPRGK